MSVSAGLIAYTIIFIIIVAICYIFDKIKESNHAWNISKSQLMTCKNCNHVFFSGRHDHSGKCPRCGRQSAAFRFPQSEIKARIRQQRI